MTSSTTAFGGGPPSPEGEGFWILYDPFMPSPVGMSTKEIRGEVSPFTG